MQINEILNEEWSRKYKKSINCSHPKGFSQKAHCAGKKKTNESMSVMEMTCPDCGKCQTHGSIMEIKKGAKDSNGVTKCWSGYHAAGTKKSATTGKQVRNCVPNESVEEEAKHGLYYNVNKRKKAGTSRDADSPKAPTAQAWKDAAKTAKNESTEINGEHDNFTPADLKSLERIRDLPTLKARAKELIKGKPVKRMKPEKIAFFYDRVDQLNSPLVIIKMMYDMLLAGEGHKVIGSKSSMDPNSYRARFGEDIDNAEYNDEAGMFKNDLQTIQRVSTHLEKAIYDNENLPEWCQAKISQAKGMVVAVMDYMVSQHENGIVDAMTEEFDLIESIINTLAVRNQVDADVIWEDLESLTDDELYVFAVTQPVMEDWQKANKKDKTDGMSQKAVNSYRREHPGSKLKTAVTTKPSKLKKGSKASKRRKSYCSRSRGQMKMHSISCAKTPDKAICKARRRWNCE
jgi:hypothetical protein